MNPDAGMGVCVSQDKMHLWLEDLRFCGGDVIIYFDILSNYD